MLTRTGTKENVRKSRGSEDGGRHGKARLFAGCFRVMLTSALSSIFIGTSDG